jgi:hypothetical protein
MDRVLRTTTSSILAVRLVTHKSALPSSTELIPSPWPPPKVPLPANPRMLKSASSRDRSSREFRYVQPEPERCAKMWKIRDRQILFQLSRLGDRLLSVLVYRPGGHTVALRRTDMIATRTMTQYRDDVVVVQFPKVRSVSTARTVRTDAISRIPMLDAGFGSR